MLKKLYFILTKKEIKDLIALSIGSLFFSIFETFSIGIIIPIMTLYLNMEKINTSAKLQWLYRISGAKNEQGFLFMLVVIAMIIFITKAVYSVFLLYKQQKFVGVIFNRLTSNVLSSYLNKDYSFYFDYNSSILFKNICSEVSQFTAGFLTPIIQVSSEFLVMICLFILLFCVYPAVTFSLVAGFSVILLSMNILSKKRIASYAYAREKHSEEMFKSALESLHAVKEIKIYNVSRFFVDRFLQAVTKYTNGYIKFNVISGLPRYLLETLLFVSVLGVLLVGVSSNIKMAQLIPMMTVLGLASLRLLPSINKIYSNTNMLHYSLNSLDIIYKILQDKEKPFLADRQADNGEPLVLAKDNFIKLEGITFSYKESTPPIFSNLHLSIPINHTIALVGETGAGKSTLADILTGLLIPSSGKFYYAGCRITSENMLEYRKKIGYVLQQTFLTDDTLEANIAFGVPEEQIDVERIQYAIKLSYLGPFVDTLKDGVKTKIGERGIKFSGGQKQRIGIARALYRKPEILIMDEATSSLDAYTESEIGKALKELSGKLTVIIIAHRLSTIQQTDIIYVLDKGNIVAQGNFKELSDHSPVFKKITNQKIYL